MEEIEKYGKGFENKTVYYLRGFESSMEKGGKKVKHVTVYCARRG